MCAELRGYFSVLLLYLSEVWRKSKLIVSFRMFEMSIMLIFSLSKILEGNPTRFEHFQRSLYSRLLYSISTGVPSLTNTSDGGVM